MISLNFFLLFVELKAKGAWTELEYHSRFNVSPKAVKQSPEVERIHVQDVNPEEFIEKFEKPYTPVVILGCTEDWKANYKWTPNVSLEREFFV